MGMIVRATQRKLSASVDVDVSGIKRLKSNHHPEDDDLRSVARGRPFRRHSANLLMTPLRVVAGPHDGRNLTRNQGSFRGCEIGEGLAALLARYDLGARYGYVSLRLQNEGNRVLTKSRAGYSGFRQLAGVE